MREGEVLVRILTGFEAGKEVAFNPAQGATLKLPKHPGFARCSGCDLTTPHYEEYEIFKFSFVSGHRHYYAAPKGTGEAGALNILWAGFEKRNLP